MSTASTVQHHIKALADGDLDEVMADYSDASVFITNDQTITGLAGIRAVFQGALANGGFKVNLQHEVYADDIGYITWNVPGAITLGTDTFVVRDGVIVVQTAAMAMAGK